MELTIENVKVFVYSNTDNLCLTKNIHCNAEINISNIISISISDFRGLLNLEDLKSINSGHYTGQSHGYSCYKHGDTLYYSSFVSDTDGKNYTTINTRLVGNNLLYWEELAKIKILVETNQIETYRYEGPLNIQVFFE